jgi:hypothetical protein
MKNKKAFLSNFLETEEPMIAANRSYTKGLGPFLKKKGPY